MWDLANANPLTQAELGDALEKHANFLEAGNAGGTWQTVETSGITIAVYQGKGEPVRLECRRFEGLDLKNISLTYATFVGSTFRDQDLSGGNFEGSIFADCDFTGARLENANMKRVDVSRSIFRQANLRNVNFENADLENAVFLGADLTGANLNGAKIPGAIGISVDIDIREATRQGNLERLQRPLQKGETQTKKVWKGGPPCILQ